MPARESTPSGVPDIGDRTPPEGMPIGDYSLWWHFEKLRRSFHRRGGKCRQCWHARRLCVCDELAVTLAPPRCVTPNKGALSNGAGVALVVLFHHEEVGRASCTSKLAVQHGGARGYVAGLRRSHLDSGWIPADAIPPGLGTEDDFLEDLAGWGLTCVLFPSPDAVAVDVALSKWENTHVEDPRTRELTKLESESRRTVGVAFELLVRLHRLHVAVDAIETALGGPGAPPPAAAPVGARSGWDAMPERVRHQLLALTDPQWLSRLPRVPSQANPTAAPATFVVLDGTYRQAKHLNNRVVPRRHPRVKIVPGGPSLYLSRKQSEQRALSGRISTIEALLELVLAIDPGFAALEGPPGYTAWVGALQRMVDAVKLQRGQPAAYQFGDDLTSNGRFVADGTQSHGAVVARPTCCPLCCAKTTTFRNRGALPGRPPGSRTRVWMCRSCRQLFHHEDPTEIPAVSGAGI